MKKSTCSFSNVRKYISKWKCCSSPYFSGFFHPGFPCCPNFSNKDQLFTITLCPWLRIHCLPGLSYQGLNVKTSFPYWAKTQRQNSVKCKETSLSSRRTAALWVRREAGNGKVALQPSSEGSRVPCALVPTAIMNGRAALPECAALKGSPSIFIPPERERPVLRVQSVQGDVSLL